MCKHREFVLLVIVNCSRVSVQQCVVNLYDGDDDNEHVNDDDDDNDDSDKVIDSEILIQIAHGTVHVYSTYVCTMPNGTMQYHTAMQTRVSVNVNVNVDLYST